MKKPAWILLLFLFSCAQKPKTQPVRIGLTNGNRSIKFSGLDNAIVDEINRDSTRGIWENLAPVFKMPADTELKNYQPVQHGSYVLKDSSVIFTPDTPFVKGQAYFIRYYIFKGENMWDYIKAKKRLGGVAYRDLVVRP